MHDITKAHHIDTSYITPVSRAYGAARFTEARADSATPSAALTMKKRAGWMVAQLAIPSTLIFFGQLGLCCSCVHVLHASVKLGSICPSP